MGESTEQAKASSEDQPQITINEAQTRRKCGGWITFPFLAGNLLGLGIAINGATSNIIVYLIRKYNVKSIDAAQISNIVNGCVNVAPVVGATVSDAYFGCYPVVACASAVAFLSLVVFTLTAAIPSLRPLPCSLSSNSCEPPSSGQYAVLYTAVGLLAIGTGGTRFNSATMGANQFDKTQELDIFFNWFFILLYGSLIVGATVVVYIQDSVGWALGFGLCTVATAVSVVALLLGSRYYRRPKAQGSPFIGLAQVAAAAARKRKINLLDKGRLDYYYGTADAADVAISPPTESFSFLNRAAVIPNGDIHRDGSIAQPWHLCTVQQVEDFKTLVRILPLWTTSIFVSVSIGIQVSMTILQALTVDRSLGRHFTVPAGSISVSNLAAVVVSIILLDRFLFPLCNKLTHHTLTPLQRIGLGHVINTIGMAASALMERKRAAIVHAHHAENQAAWIAPMSVLWLVLPLAVVGVGEALHFPGQVGLYYQEFPKALKSTATGMASLIVALGFYLSTAVVGLVRRVTAWLPDNLNDSRLENVYWMLAAVGTVNFGYYILCAKLYEYHSIVKDEEAVAN
ncbi:protein NRT1/ PTR FAMILY 2.7-like [Ananas comosus]|uniref:Protein NRT1/ PTR FAMILY 2.7-like n=1 Tax=Ananas comosus TaxID=4615 RepID=A0A6P5EYA2_ANACO|nr:protein NRT1/ PTR FAMILY 2.7-like [Ananas comosus]